MHGLIGNSAAVFPMQAAGQAVVHARFHRPLQLSRGYIAVEATLTAHARPLAALWGVERRLDEQLARDDATLGELYLGRSLGDFLERIVLPEFRAADQTGPRWFAGLIHLIGPEAELELRGFVGDIALDSPR